MIEVLIEHPADSDAEELSRVAYSFARQIRDQVDVQSVQFTRDREAPTGAKAGDALALGHLLVVAVPSAAVLRGLIALAKAKVQADATKSVKLTVDGHVLEVTNMSELQQEQAIQAWIETVEDARDDG